MTFLLKVPPRRRRSLEGAGGFQEEQGGKERECVKYERLLCMGTFLNEKGAEGSAQEFLHSRAETKQEKHVFISKYTEHLNMEGRNTHTSHFS